LKVIQYLSDIDIKLQFTRFTSSMTFEWT